jgi:integrase
MSKSISLSISVLGYKNTLKVFGAILFNPERLKEQPYRTIIKNLTRHSDINSEVLANIVGDWWQEKIPYLTFNQLHMTGLSVRLYKAKFRKSGKNIKALNYDEQGSVYFRYRDHNNQKLITKKLGLFSPHSFSGIIDTVKKVKASNELGINVFADHPTSGLSNESIMTLKEFLYGSFLETKIDENPKTADKKVKVVTRYFGNLLNVNINCICAANIREWLKTKERKLTQRQINAGDSRWVLKPSTLKEAVGVIRSCLELAKEKGIISDHDLYTLPKFKMDNEIIRYLSDSEELRLYDVINKRNDSRLAQRISTITHRVERDLPPPPSLLDCKFADHVTPFIILFKETGIRPGTLLNSKWTDVDFEARFFRIRKSIDKKSLANFVPLNDLAHATLIEWQKHHIHKDCLSAIDNKSNAWLFPSPKSPSEQLTTIKTAWRRLIKKAGIENFRFYDLRHDFASKIMMRTGNIYLVSHLLNHRQIETTKRYAHLMDKSKLLAVQTLDSCRQKDALPDFLKERT